MRYNKSIKNKIILVFMSLFAFKNLTQSNMFKKQYTANVIGKAIFKNQWLLVYPFETENKSITISKIFRAIKSIPTEMKSPNFLSFKKMWNLEIYIGVNIIINPNKTESAGIKNQFPWVWIQQTPNNKHNAKYIEHGIKINLCFLINFGRFVKVKARISAENTIQNQVKPLFIAKSQIKQGIRVIT